MYSDHGTGALRTLFLDHCRWEWLFGFENREAIFDIHRSFKFNPLVIEKGGRTEAIRTAFMRRSFREWEQAEQIATPYTRAQVERFSPRSRAILEVESARDLEILEKIYANSVLLGDDGLDGWGVKYSTEFHMTNDSKLFPPRPKWEAQEYRPDEYSRWLKGNWRPIAELWPELGVDPAQVVPADIVLEEWLFDSSAGPGERSARGEYVHGHLLKPGDVQRTPWRLRCAQPPYDSLPIPRAEIPAGIVLSREANAWMRVDEIEDIALPLYEGRMINMFDFSEKGWVSGKGRTAKWDAVPVDQKYLRPQYLMASVTYEEEQFKRYIAGVKSESGAEAAADEERRLSDPLERRAWAALQARRVSFMDVTSSTNTRTIVGAVTPRMPAGNKVPALKVKRVEPELLCSFLDSFVFDYVMRRRLTGLSANFFLLREAPLPALSTVEGAARALSSVGLALNAISAVFAERWISAEALKGEKAWRSCFALLDAERLRLRCMVDAVAALAYGIEESDLDDLLDDNPLGQPGKARSPKGFWRVDYTLDPELRHPVLFRAAFRSLNAEVRACNGDTTLGVSKFLSGSDGAGWHLPESLLLSDYGLSDETRGLQAASVARRLGPRFFDWQLTQCPEESWRECHVHARNLQEVTVGQILVDSDGDYPVYVQATRRVNARVAESQPQTTLFD
ncbi:MAG: hypothetical protein HEQ38_12815 [Gemmatimonas sp.]|nr:hypothetical protein [Gemmatimonas sp.]